MALEPAVEADATVIAGDRMLAHPINRKHHIPAINAR